jgi:phosphatidylethanolamine/phosphatidyl-N-methylethanolamine N-methyltransferase
MSQQIHEDTSLNITDTALLVREFIRHPGAIGAIAPSSRRLALEATAPIPQRGDPVVVELGCGTGAFTGAIQARLGARGTHIAVEVNPRLAEVTAQRYPAVSVIQESAEHLASILGRRGLTHADVVVSALPWAAFTCSLQASILDAIYGVIAPAGAFSTFGYLGASAGGPARRFRRMLTARFEEVVIGRTVMCNLPPARVYFGRRPMHA